MSIGHYKLIGQTAVPCDDDFLDWASWMKKNGIQHVADTWLYRERVRVSTIFLGIDRNFSGGPPLLFETMIFGGVLDGSQWRYPDWLSAEAGHREAVGLVRDWVLWANIVCSRIEAEFEMWMDRHVVIHKPPPALNDDQLEFLWRMTDFTEKMRPIVERLEKSIGGNIQPPTFWERVLGRPCHHQRQESSSAVSG